MYREKISPARLGAWMFAATVPVALQLLAGASWVWVGLAGLAGLVLIWLLGRSAREPGKWEKVLLTVYVIVLTGELLRPIADSWPVGNSDPAVPLILLALAAVSAGKGLSAAARVGAVLFWVVLGLYAMVLLSGVKSVQLSWLSPRWNAPDLLGLTVYLLPVAALQLKEGEKPIKRRWLTVAFILVGSLVTAGVLSPQMAQKMPNAFYEMSRSLELMGVAKRFEALICAGVTIGWFSLLSFLLTLAGSYLQGIFPGLGKAVPWIAAGAAGAWRLCGLHIPAWFLLMCGSVFWVVVPLLAQGLGKIKKS